MRFIALGAAAAIASVLTWDADAADLTYPSAIGSPQYAGAPTAPVGPRHVFVLPPGSDTPARPLIGSSPNGVFPLPPRAACAPVWLCADRACGWAPSCAPAEAQPYAAYPGLPSGPDLYGGSYADVPLGPELGEPFPFASPEFHGGPYLGLPGPEFYGPYLYDYPYGYGYDVDPGYWLGSSSVCWDSGRRIPCNPPSM
jgi:hypothetical protein